MAYANLFVILSGCIFICFLFGIHNFLLKMEENKCEMTYMFEYPQYVKISFSGKIEKQFSRYGLYAYGEGQTTEKLRQMRFSGVPVLFIPGNSGSHKQVRSLASVSLRKSMNKHLPFHFDYFSMDLNEEYSALFGGILKDQTEFTHLCIKKILGLYKSLPTSPTSVILIGHSMGGMIAKGVFLEPDFDPKMVRVVLTIATAHSLPVVSLDPYIASFYEEINNYWVQEKGEGALSHVTLISIGGGTRDILVRAGLTYEQTADVSVVTTAIPTVWLSTDHQCSVWCKQLVLVIIRCLFDIVDTTSRQITSDVDDRRQVFRYHLLERSAGKRRVTWFHPPAVAMDRSGEWTEELGRQYSVVLPHGVPTPQYAMVRLVDDPKHQQLAVEAIYLTPKDWVFACMANQIQGNSRYCEMAVNLSNNTRISPSVKYRRKLVYLNLAKLKRMAFTHVILRVMPTNDMVQLNVDIYERASRNVVAKMPHMLSMFSMSVVPSTPNKAVHLEVFLPDLAYAWQAYHMHIEPLSCSRATHHATATLHIPWSNENSHQHVTENINGFLAVKLHVPRPLAYKGKESPSVRLVLDPYCKYSISLESSLHDSLGQLVRFYGPQLLPYMAAILILTLRYQLASMYSTGSCIMFHSALGSGAKPYFVLPVVKLTSKIISTGELGVRLQPYLPPADSVVLQETNLDFLLLPFLLYCVAFSIVYLLGLGVWASTLLSGHAVHKMALRFVSNFLLGSLSWSEWVLAGLSRLPIVVAGFLLALCCHACGALAICLGAAFYFFKLCKMYEEYLEELFKYSVKLLLKKARKEKQPSDVDEDKTPTQQKSSEEALDGEGGDRDPQSRKKRQKPPTANYNKTTRKNRDTNKEQEGENANFSLSEFHFHFTAFLLWLTAAITNIPSTLVWAHNYSYNTKLLPDPSLEMGVTLCVCAGVLWQGKKPRPDLGGYRVVGYILYVVAVLILMFATLSLHHLSPLVGVVFIVISIHQLLWPCILSETLSDDKKNA